MRVGARTLGQERDYDWRQYSGVFFAAPGCHRSWWSRRGEKEADGVAKKDHSNAEN